MKRWLPVAMFILALCAAERGMAKIAVEGVLSTEMQVQPQDAGGLTVLPGAYFPTASKLGLVIRDDGSSPNIRARFPLLLSLNPLKLNNVSDLYITGPTFDAGNWYNFFGSDYYFVMRSAPFSVGVTNRKLSEDPDYAFYSFGDPLGIFLAPNSEQPILTMKATGKLAGAELELYRIYDQPVSLLPAAGILPAAVAALPLTEESTIADYPWRTEQANYTLGRISGKTHGLTLGLLFGEKTVDNPGFWSDPAAEQPVYYEPAGGERLSLAEQNIGLAVSGEPLGVRAQAEYVSGRRDWRLYEGKETVDGRQMPKWSSLGANEGAAGQISLSGISLGPAKVNFLYRAIDPSFSPVAARDENYAYGLFNQEPSDYDSPLLYRALYDPRKNRLRSGFSSVLPYIGFRSAETDLTLPGKFLSYDAQFSLSAERHSRMDEARQRELDPKRGDKLVKDFQELAAGLALFLGDADTLEVKTLNRDYLADYDYLTLTGTKWTRMGDGYTRDLAWEEYGRLRRYAADAQGLTSVAGSLTRFLWQLQAYDLWGMELNGTVDLRRGTYEKDLTLQTEDRVLAEPYQLALLRAFAQRGLAFPLARRRVTVDLAAELKQLSGRTRTPQLEAALGVSTVGYLRASFPWSGSLRQEMLLLGVRGPENENFPSGFLHSAWHNELIYQPTAQDGLRGTWRLGYTSRQAESARRGNLFAQVRGELGIGSWSFTYGAGTLPEFTDPERLLPGEWRAPVPYPEREVLGKPWESWRDANVALGNEETLHRWFTLRYWYSF